MVRQGCVVCSKVPPGELIDLDLLLADPMRWPETIWNGMVPPEGDLPASYRRFGAVEMGVAWAMEHPQYELTKAQIRKHWRYDVPVLEVDPEALVAKGLIVRGDPKAPTTEAIDPLAYVRFYNTGIKLGQRGFEAIGKMLDKMEADGEAIPFAMARQLVDMGSKLAQSQAALRARGGMNEDADAMDGFRPQDASPRFGHERVRTIEGEARPVRDEGPADRAHYNERARAEGSPTIGGR